ncbi:MAG TPA: hypothetical protein VFT22_11785 [Kofleriaceae bacterium]|nr:hypothetical protein [Kofleriaceae bacterium]
MYITKSPASRLFLSGIVCAAACGIDTADHQVPARPTYIEDIAPVLSRACVACHGAPSSTTEARNCVRTDHWETSIDASHLCSDSATGGMIFGVHDAGPMIVDNVVTRRMPLSDAPLTADDLELFARWRDAGYPKRATNQAPTIQITAPPASGITVCSPTCTFTVSYDVADPDGDTVTWSLGWSGGGKTGSFATGLTGGTGNLTIDASPLASGTYTLTAQLDDGTATTTTDLPGLVTVPAGHNAAPAVTVTSPNGGESYYDTQPVTITWTGSDLDGTTLSYDVAAIGTTRLAIQTLTAPVGPAQLTWTPPAVTALTSFTIEVVAHDQGIPSLSATDRSDAAFSISPPPQNVSFSKQLQPIFDASCSGAQCHDASQPASGLQLTAGTSYGALVGPSSTEAPCTGYRLVAPGQPDQSYLVFKLQGSGACTSGSRMPKGAAALSAAQLQLFRDWIANGAPNN